MKSIVRGGLLAFLAMTLVATARAQDKKPAKPELKKPTEAKPEHQALAREVRDIMEKHCFDCHNGPGSKGGGAVFDVLKVSTLISELADPDDPAVKSKPVITPGDLAKSKFWRLIENDRMPNRTTKLSAAEKDKVKKWIEAGSPDYPAAAERAFISLEDEMKVIYDDVRAAARKDRPYLRYFTLTHLHNNKKIYEDRLQMVRAALSKAVNSLSWKETIVRPRAVKNSHDTIYAIDLRDYDWDKGRLWFEILKQYPYGVRYDQHNKDRKFRDLDRELYDLAKHEDELEPELRMVRADWFVATATRPPLYYSLLYDAYLPALQQRAYDPVAAKSGNPKRMTAKDLEDFLGVDIRENFENPTTDRIARAGFSKSGVSGQNRLVERHRSRHGAYWKSYDFKADSKRIKLVRYPLGPLNLFPEGHHPYKHQAFIHDGGEIIFNLPNGLQAYLLIDGNDSRIDEGPIQVVGDESKTSGTPAVVNGISCMHCHKHGMIPFKDRIREGSALYGPAREKVEDLYPEQFKMDALLNRDTAKFMTALEQTIGPLMKPLGNKPLTEYESPVGLIARRYRNDYLDLDTVALELGQKDSNVLKVILGQDEFQKLGLDVLSNGGEIGRLEWEINDGPSLMQLVATKLGGRPYQPAK